MDNEYKRKGIHILNGLWAFALPVFPRLFAIIIVTLALIFVFILARPQSKFGSIFSHSFENMAREYEREKGYLYGPTIYVSMILLLVLFADFRIAGAVFAILAFGDGTATVFGKKFGYHKFRNNKSLEGSMAFLIFSLFSSFIVFSLINKFNTPSAGLALIPSLMLPKTIAINLFWLFLIFTFICLLSALIELYISEYLNDNLVIPICGTFLFYFIINVFLTFHLGV